MLRRSFWTAALITLLALSAGRSALADAIGPPADSCPTGGEPQSCHGGQYCEPRTCTSDSVCGDRATCQTEELCIDRIDCGGGYGSYYVDEVLGFCSGGSCSEGSCEMLQICVDDDDPSLSQGCGCAAGADGTGRDTLLGLSAMAIFLLGIFLHARYRRRDE